MSDPRHPSALADPVVWRRIALITVLVGCGVFFAHRALDGVMPPWGWVLFHAVLPAAVYGAGARAAGARGLTRRLAVRGAVTVLVVAAAFTWINSGSQLGGSVRLVLNLLVPLTVSSLGAAGGGRIGRPRRSS